MRTSEYEPLKKPDSPVDGGPDGCQAEGPGVAEGPGGTGAGGIAEAAWKFDSYATYIRTYHNVIPDDLTREAWREAQPPRCKLRVTLSFVLH